MFWYGLMISGLITVIIVLAILFMIAIVAKLIRLGIGLALIVGIVVLVMYFKKKES